MPPTVDAPSDGRSVAALAERTVGAAGGHLDAIAGEGTTGRIAGLLGDLPTSISRFYGFEVRADAHGADLLLQLQPAETIASGLTRLLAGGDPKVEQALLVLLEGATADGDKEFACDDVWVEYDLDREPRETLPPPSLFCAPGLSRGGSLQRTLIGDREETIELAVELERRAWPRAVAFQLGGMLSRRLAPLRVVLTGERLGPWLAELDHPTCDADEWETVVARAARLLEQLGSAGSDIIDLDIVDGALAPAIGIELPASDRPSLQRTAGLLGERSLASREWLAAVRSWHGDVVATSSTHADHLAVDHPTAFPGKIVEHGVRRRVHHFKVALRADRRPAVKAYLSLGLGVRVSRGALA